MNRNTFLSRFLQRNELILQGTRRRERHRTLGAWCGISLHDHVRGGKFRRVGWVWVGFIGHLNSNRAGSLLWVTVQTLFYSNFGRRSLKNENICRFRNVFSMVLHSTVTSSLSCACHSKLVGCMKLSLEIIFRVIEPPQRCVSLNLPVTLTGDLKHYYGTLIFLE